MDWLDMLEIAKICLTGDQAKYINKNVEYNRMVNAEMIKQELEDDRLNKDNVDKEEENQYWKIIINDFDRNDIIISQIEQWSILGNIDNYVQYDRKPKDLYNLEVW